MKATQITWTRIQAGSYANPDTGIEIHQGESGRWFVYEGDKLVRSAANLSLAKVAAKPIILVTLYFTARVVAAHVEALRMEADRIVEQDGADALIHHYDTDMQTPDGVDLTTTPYTFGSPVWPEVTCPVCLSTRVTG